MTAIEIIAVAIAVVGSVFTILGAIGVVRMPDIYTRLSTAAKTSALGVTSLVFAATLLHGDMVLAVRAVFVIAFVFLTVPVASHLIGRAAYMSGAPLWSKTTHNDLKGKYDRNEGTLRGDPDAESKTAPPDTDKKPDEEPTDR
jgi:multicomponent Na+:H+ antiporter subunit G